MSSLSKKYDWYPNRQIESPLSVISVSPSPKKFTYGGERRGTQQFSLKIMQFDTIGASPLKTQSKPKVQDQRKFSQLMPINEKFIYHHEDWLDKQ